MKYTIYRHVEPHDLTVDIACQESDLESFKLRCAVFAAAQQGYSFHSAHLDSANLSNSNLGHLDFRNANVRANFENSNMSHCAFDLASLEKVNFSSSFMTICSFKKADLSRANFANAVLNDVDFTFCNLIDADFTGADIRTSLFKGADLTDATLPVKSSLLPYGPTVENIHQKIAEAVKTEGALMMGGWHEDPPRCATTHCLAGWAVHLAGEAGYALEERQGTPIAAAAIFANSDSTLTKIPDFYNHGNKEALEYIQARAKAEAERSPM